MTDTAPEFAKVPTKGKSAERISFFEFLFQDYDGYVCIGTTLQEAPRATFSQKFFKWPTDLRKMENYILSAEKKFNVYFCVNLLSEMERTKDRALPTDLLWADLDEVHPHHESILETGILPSAVIESSPNRYQAFWRLTTKIEPYLAEQYSRRIAYAFDADKSGWDLTQLVRVPFTRNWKYAGAPTVDIFSTVETRLAPVIVERMLPELPASENDDPLANTPAPELVPSDAIILKHTMKLKKTDFALLFGQEPAEGEDWSRLLWKLIHVCLDADLPPEDVYSVVYDAACNKYKRDGRPAQHLWRDVLRASQSHTRFNIITGNVRELEMPQLVEEPASETFIAEYRAWAEEATDAVPEFHDLCCFILMSAIISNSVRFDTSYGPMVPNLWGLVLGDSTLTRKTTSMKMVTDLLMEFDKSMIVATEGTAEGLLQGLSERPNRSSIFFKDEVSGFFDAIAHKDYLAGFTETLTALYDVPGVMSRRLRKETILIESPSFIFFGGGVKDRVYESLNDSLVLSGFLPRFLVVSGDTDLGRLRRTGPANPQGIAKRAAILSRIADLYETYVAKVITHIGGQEIDLKPMYEAVLTDEAWQHYGDIEERMVILASTSSIADMALPTFERLSRSLLKMSVVLACVRQHPDVNNKILVEESDVINAAWYVQQWGKHSIDLVINAGKRLPERMFDRVIKTITNDPGILRSALMQRHHLTKREADEIFSTLEDRVKIRKERAGNGWRYFLA